MFGLNEEETLMFNISVVVGTTMIAGIMSGLTIGIFSIDENYVRSMVSSPREKDRKRAQRLLLLIGNPHWLLVTLLLCNAAAVETLPLALDEMMSAIAAVAISVSLVLVFGEIIPQAIFVRHAFVVGALFAYPIRLVMIVTSPISYTVAKFLDIVIGHRGGTFFRRRELREFLELQITIPDELSEMHPSGEGKDDAPPEDRITGAEIKVMLGALSLSEKTVSDIMKRRLGEIFSVELNHVMGKETVERIFKFGYSRIPVYDKDPANITHYIISKTMITFAYKKEADAPRAKELTLRKPFFCTLSTLLSVVYNEFIGGAAHLMIVQDDDGKAIGLVTANDLLEAMHQTSFRDETDLMSQQPVQIIMKSWKDLQQNKCSGVVSSKVLQPGSNERKSGFMQSERPVSHANYHSFTDSLLPQKKGDGYGAMNI